MPIGVSIPCSSEFQSHANWSFNLMPIGDSISRQLEFQSRNFFIFLTEKFLWEINKQISHIANPISLQILRYILYGTIFYGTYLYYCRNNFYGKTQKY